MTDINKMSAKELLKNKSISSLIASIKAISVFDTENGIAEEGLDCIRSKPYENEILSRFSELERENTELRNWKESQLDVESRWNAQLVAKEMELKLGSDIRVNILPFIKRLKSENADLKKQVEKAVSAIEYVRLCISVLNGFNTQFKMDDIIWIVNDYYQQSAKESAK